MYTISPPMLTISIGMQNDDISLGGTQRFSTALPSPGRSLVSSGGSSINRVQGVPRGLPLRVTEQTEAWSVQRASHTWGTSQILGRKTQMVQSYAPSKSRPKTSVRRAPEDYYDARATGASSRAIPFQEPHGSFLPPSPVLSFLPRPLAAQ